jgi:hypothetical protein
MYKALITVENGSDTWTTHIVTDTFEIVTDIGGCLSRIAISGLLLLMPRKMNGQRRISGTTGG